MMNGEIAFGSGLLIGLLLGALIMILAPGEVAPQCRDGEMARKVGADWYCGGFTGRYQSRFEWRAAE